MTVPSNQLKVTFIFILPFNLVHFNEFFLFHIEIEGKVAGLLGGPKGMLAPPPPHKLLGGAGPPAPPLSSYACGDTKLLPIS